MDTIKMSSKGQIVIPQGIREHLGVGEGSLFAVVETDKAIMLKCINKPSKEELIVEWKRMAEQNQKIVDKLGIKENDVQNIIEKRRKLDRLS